MNEVGCAVCGSRDNTRVARLASADVMECRECGLIFCGELPSIVSQSSGRHSVLTQESYTAGLLSISRFRMKRYERLARGRYSVYARRLGLSRFRLLEIGCGSAGMAEEFQRLGVDYSGIDLDERTIGTAVDRGVKSVHVADFLDLEFPDEPFDVIAASQVLEHSTEPRRFIEHAATYLRPGGILHLDVPNHDSLASQLNRAVPRTGNRWGAIEWPHHVFSYRARVLERLLAGSFECCVFGATCDDPVWGQAFEPHLAALIYYRASAILRAPSILVSMGRRRADHSISGDAR